jgi:hypothetical protein
MDFSPALGLHLEPLAADDIGQAAAKENDGENQKKQIEHRVCLLPFDLLPRAVPGL